MGLKERIYRATGTAAARALLARLPARVAFVEPATGQETRVVITVDTEGGFVGAGERRVWQGSAPDAFQGYVDGLRHACAVFAKHDVRATFFVAPHGLSATGETRRAVDHALAAVRDGGHEIGLHLHPSSDRAVRARVGGRYDATAARIPSAARRALVAAGRDLLAEATGVTPRSFRWGNWALDAESAVDVAAEGFTVDASAVPGLWDVRSPRRPRYDWRRTRTHRPFTLCEGLAEVPITTFSCLGNLFRADPIYAPLLPAALRAHAEAGTPAFVLMTHSSELTAEDGSPTRALADLDAFLGLARALGHRFATVAGVA